MTTFSDEARPKGKGKMKGIKPLNKWWPAIM